MFACVHYICCSIDSSANQSPSGDIEHDGKYCPLCVTFQLLLSVHYNQNRILKDCKNIYDAAVTT